MRKSATNIHTGPSPQRSAPSLFKIATVVLTGVVSAPLVIECVNLYYAKWSTIMGKSADARTPILESIHETFVTNYDALGSVVGPYFWRFLNHPAVLLPAVAVTIVMGMFVLRTSGHNRA
jgi:hypothetical protein